MSDLQSNVIKAWEAKRPLLHRRKVPSIELVHALMTVSEGTCWLVSFPYTAPGQAEGRMWYHFMLDSWVWGEVGMLGGWAVKKSFKVGPKYTCFEEIKGICQKIEDITHRFSGQRSVNVILDALVISHFRIDHIAPQVLRAIPSSTPVFASSLAHGSILKLKHFDKVHHFGAYESPVSDSKNEHLPPWLNLGLLISRTDFAYDTPSVIISFGFGDTVQAIIYALHGIHPKNIGPIIQNKAKVLGLMAGLTAAKAITSHFIAYSGPQVLACVRAVEPKWWIMNHDDENINVSGSTVRALSMDVYDLKRVFKEEAGEGEVRGLEGTELVDLRQGESLAMV